MSLDIDVEFQIVVKGTEPCRCTFKIPNDFFFGVAISKISIVCIHLLCSSLMFPTRYMRSQRFSFISASIYMSIISSQLQLIVY